MFASACVAIAPTSASAAGTPAPTARNFDCTATPHSAASRSQATMEYVDGLAIFQPAEVELRQLPLFRRDEDARDLGALERSPHLVGARGAYHDRNSLRMGLLQAADVCNGIEHESVVECDLVLALDRDFGDAPARGAEPAFSHSS